MTYLSSSLALGGTLTFVLIIVALAVLLFEIVMFFDAARNPALDATTKLLWLAGMLLLHPFVAIVYYYVGRKPRPPLG